MLAYIKANYQPGDTIEITCSEGVVTGQIEFVNSKYIVLRQPNGQICGISGNDVRTFSAACPVPLVPASLPATKAPAEEPDSTEPIGENEDIDNAAAPAGSQAGLHLTPELAPKVVGRIPPERLEQIDPKLSRRTYFRREEEKEAADQASAPHAGADDYQPAEQAEPNASPYVPPKGRITYYNPDKHFGFIRDFNDTDHYFQQQQVADNRLYDYLRRGTKVTFTSSRNAQGNVALCVHLPHTVNDLLPMAEDFYDSRHYQLAEGIVMHILEVYPDNRQALDLLDEIRNTEPQPVAAQPYRAAADASVFTPSPLYTQAKKYYLAKDSANAEAFYLKALEAGEKPDSCVKDLVTLYVSNYKQASTPEEQDACRQKAADFLNAHFDTLPDNLTTKQFLALNYYLPVQEYDRFIHAVDDIMVDPVVAASPSKMAFYLWQKATALNKMGKTDEAKAVIDEGLRIMPQHTQLRKLHSFIDNPESSAEGTSAPAGADGQAEMQAPDTTATAPEAATPAGQTEPEAANTGEEKPDSWWQSLTKPW